MFRAEAGEGFFQDFGRAGFEEIDLTFGVIAFQALAEALRQHGGIDRKPGAHRRAAQCLERSPESLRPAAVEKHQGVPAVEKDVGNAGHSGKMLDNAGLRW